MYKEIEAMALVLPSPLNRFDKIYSFPNFTLLNSQPFLHCKNDERQECKHTEIPLKMSNDQDDVQSVTQCKVRDGQRKPDVHALRICIFFKCRS